jgi:hypothetical protein
MKAECIPGDCTYDVQVNATYDLAGDVITMSNGSTGQPITFSYTYDSAVRLQTLTSNWTTGADHPPTLFQANSTSQSQPSYGLAGLLYAELGLPSGSQTASVTQVRTYDDRLRINGETYTASAVETTSPTGSSGTISITGTEQSTQIGQTAATGTVTISGAERSTQINPCEPHSSCPETIYDSGTITVTVNGSQYTTGYSEGLLLCGALSSVFRAASRTRAARGIGVSVCSSFNFPQVEHRGGSRSGYR